jgi:hypothetical protein
MCAETLLKYEKARARKLRVPWNLLPMELSQEEKQKILGVFEARPDMVREAVTKTVRGLIEGVRIKREVTIQFQQA